MYISMQHRSLDSFACTSQLIYMIGVEKESWEKRQEQLACLDFLFCGYRKKGQMYVFYLICWSFKKREKIVRYPHWVE